jgi:CheY-like chemotaxis protein
MRALIVDDNAAARLVFEHILQGHGLTTHTAGHGEDALAELVRAKAAGQPYRVLILDWKMARLDGIQTLRQVQSVLGVDAPQCIMATAYDPDSLQEELGPTRVATIVQKPVTGKQLLEAIHMALQTDSAPIERSGPTSGSANLAELSRLLSGTHVLLVEDNVTNQELAMELLAAVGTTADIANDGVEALSMLERTPYALVLMDCQMPVMDGFEATRRLRAQGRFADLPVIAMTANAMAGERERCLSAGMSDYLSKPIDLGLLYSKLVHWAPRAGRTAALAIPEVTTAATGQAPVAGTVLDEAGGLARTNANHALYERLLRKFSQREADASAHLDAALRAGDRDTALRNIHNLKGIAATIGGHALSAACLTLENELRKPSQAPQSVILAKQQWQTELDRLLAYLQQRPVHSDESGSATPVPSGSALIPPGVAAQCAELRSLLVSSDARANRLAESLAETLRATELEQQARLIARHAARFDYDEALTSLQALQERLD